MENYKLDPAWYYISPGLAWDAMLKRTGVTLELLTDVDMLFTFKNGIRGAFEIYTILRCKQPLWLGYVETIT